MAKKWITASILISNLMFGVGGSSKIATSKKKERIPIKALCQEKKSFQRTVSPLCLYDGTFRDKKANLKIINELLFAVQVEIALKKNCQQRKKGWSIKQILKAGKRINVPDCRRVSPAILRVSIATSLASDSPSWEYRGLMRNLHAFNGGKIVINTGAIVTDKEGKVRLPGTNKSTSFANEKQFVRCQQSSTFGMQELVKEVKSDDLDLPFILYNSKKLHLLYYPVS